MLPLKAVNLNRCRDANPDKTGKHVHNLFAEKPAQTGRYLFQI